MAEGTAVNSPPRWMDALSAKMEVWSEGLNPILVRETRQRIKGRFFPATFLLLVALCWLVCVSTVLTSEYSPDRVELGPRLLSTLLLVLGVPLCFAAPLNLFRSITQEFEGQTFEVLAVTTLSPGRIVFGKLQSSLVEVGAYACAIAPFICFSYLLRGVSLATLLACLAIVHFAGLLSAIAAMLLGAISKKSYLQAISIILLMIVSTVTFSFAADLASWGLVRGRWPISEMLQGMICFAMAVVFGGVFSLAIAISQFTPTHWQPSYLPRPDGAPSFFPRSPSDSKKLDVRPDGRLEGSLANPFGSRLDDERSGKISRPGQPSGPDHSSGTS